MPGTVELGSWGPAQAEAVVEALRQAGIDPHVGPATPDGTVPVSVAQRDRDAAFAALVGSMDRIAVARHDDQPPTVSTTLDDDPPTRPLLFVRLRELAPLAVLLVAMLVVTLAYRGPAPAAVFLVILALMGLAVSGRRRRDDRRYGPGADRD